MTTHRTPPTDACEVRERGGELRLDGEPMEVPPAPANAPAKPAEPPTEIWKHRLRITDKGYAASAGNIELILTYDPAWRGKLRYDARADQIVIDPGAPVGDGERPSVYRNSDDTRIAIWFERSEYRIAISPSSAALAGAVGVVAETQTYDPVADYLMGLIWDGEPRMDVWAPNYLGAEDAPIHRAYGRCWMIGAVARALAPGCQVDHTLVLVGPQGRGKSTALRTLAAREEWFTDALPSLTDRKAAAEILTGRWIIEHAELESLTRSELSTAKAWLTAREDRYRAAYARRADSHPRRCVFAATTNEETFLRDATGNRRFWPVEIGEIDLDALARDRDQLWAEAVHAYRAGAPWHLTDPELIRAASESQEGRMQVDAWEPRIADWLDDLPPAVDGSEARISVGDVLAGALAMKAERWDQQSQNRVARCLTRLGWVRRQRRDADGSRRWMYVRGGAKS